MTGERCAVLHAGADGQRIDALAAPDQALDLVPVDTAVLAFGEGNHARLRDSDAKPQRDAFGGGFDFAKDADRLRESIGVADDADMGPHRLAQSGLEIFFRRRRMLLRGGCDGIRRLPVKAADIVGDARGIDHGFQQRVGGETVGAMRAGG